MRDVLAISSFSVAWAAAVVLCAQEAALSVSYQAGALPVLPTMAVAGGEVFMEVTVNLDGRVAAVTRLRTTPPFTNLVVDAVRQWSFTAGEGGAILVAAVIRPPALYGPTLGEPPRDVAPGPDRIPFPVATVLPPYPPLARASGVVLVEARVDRAGVVIETTVRRSAPPFDEAACAAVRQWRFRPAVAGGQAVSSVAYVLLGFPTPVTTPPIKK